ncbi:Cu-binding protein [Podila verticillata]|nr:Cu-binding protein [Podila verticillata]
MRVPMNNTPRFYSSKSDGARAQSASAAGALNWRTLAVFSVTGAGLLYYFRQEKQRVEEAREEEAKLAKASATYGKPKIGGPFSLIDQNGVRTTNNDFKGRYMLIYFGFTNCPDICPEELDKMAEVLDTVNKDPEIGDVITPIFITCDPQRDTVAEVNEYVKGNEIDLLSPTRCKHPTHPDGDFVDCYAKDHTAEYVSKSVKEHIEAYIAKGGKISKELGPRQSLTQA